MSTAAAVKQDTQQSTQQDSFLEQAIVATKQTERSEVEKLMSSLTKVALEGTLTWDRNLSKTINQAIEAIDEKMSKQLSAIMQNEHFLQLEGSWRGLKYMVTNSETSSQLKIKLMNVTKNELYKDLDRAVEFDQSQFFKKIYENEFGTPGGEPYGLLVGDYAIRNHPEDIDLVRNASHVAAAAFCPFITSADKSMFGFENWSDLTKVRDLEKIFDSQEYAQYREFRESDDSRFVSMVMPRVLGRLPYGKNTATIDQFNFEETDLDTKSGKSKQLDNNAYCWMNAAYVLATKINNAFSKYGWCTAIRGAEGGGKVEGLPTHIFQSDDGDIDMQCPSEIGITDRREAELSKLGFLPLCHYKNTSYAVFFGAQSTQKPQKFNKPEATANAAISARLPYILATSRFAHFLKVMARDKIGSFMELNDCEDWLNQWILSYVNGNPNVGAEMKAMYPLAEAKIKVEEVPGAPGSYHAVAWLRPWLQMEELTTSMRLVAAIPEMS